MHFVGDHFFYNESNIKYLCIHVLYIYISFNGNILNYRAGIKIKLKINAY